MTTEKILCVDDDQLILVALQSDLQGRYPIVTAQSGEEGLKAIEEQGPFGVILADMIMPGMNGVEFLSQAQRKAPDTVRLMLTGDEDKSTAVEAINEGRIFRFLSKPCAPDKLIASIDAALDQYRLIKAERELLEETLNGSVKMLTELLSLTEPAAFGRGQKVCEYIRVVAPKLNFKQTWDIEVAALLAQVGCMTIPHAVSEKQRLGIALTDREKEMVIRVPEIGYMVLRKIARLESTARIVLFQNKNFDGTGFPKDHKDLEFPRGARLLRILTDVVDLQAKGVALRVAFDQMRTKGGAYEMPLLEAVQAALVTHEAPVRGSALPLKDLVAGDELMADVFTLDDRLIARAGTVLSPMLLERFQNFAELSGLKEPIYVKHKQYQK